jgi:hypothetical protein
MKVSQSCQVTYERIVDLNEEHTTEDRASRISPSEIPPKSPPKHDITEEELKYCFRRLILTAGSDQYSPLPPGRWLMDLHGSCPKCHHQHNAVKVTIDTSHGGWSTSQVLCEGCKEIWLPFNAFVPAIRQSHA